MQGMKNGVKSLPNSWSLFFLWKVFLLSRGGWSLGDTCWKLNTAVQRLNKSSDHWEKQVCAFWREVDVGGGGGLTWTRIRAFSEENTLLSFSHVLPTKGRLNQTHDAQFSLRKYVAAVLHTAQWSGFGDLLSSIIILCFNKWLQLT